MFPLYLAPPSLLAPAPLLARAPLAPAPLLAPCTERLSEPAAPPALGPDGEREVRWADVDAVREPELELSLDWALLQLLPSPDLAVGGAGARFGLRWQVTPVLYSFAMDSRLDRCRWFISEPIVRQSGSLELFVSPDHLALDGGVAARFGARGGLRSYSSDRMAG